MVQRRQPGEYCKGKRACYECSCMPPEAQGAKGTAAMLPVALQQRPLTHRAVQRNLTEGRLSRTAPALAWFAASQPVVPDPGWLAAVVHQFQHENSFDCILATEQVCCARSPTLSATAYCTSQFCCSSTALQLLYAADVPYGYIWSLNCQSSFRAFALVICDSAIRQAFQCP